MEKSGCDWGFIRVWQKLLHDHSSIGAQCKARKPTRALVDAFLKVADKAISVFDVADDTQAARR